MNWTTKDGREIRVKDLENTHLINIYNMIWRNASYYRENALKALIGADKIIKNQQTSFKIANIIQSIENLDNEKMLDRVLEPYKAIKKEMKKRGLYTINLK